MKDKLTNDGGQLENEGFVAVSQEAEVNVIAKYGKLVGIAVVAILAIVGAFYYFSYTNTKNLEESATALSRIRPYFEQGEWQKALVGGDSVPMVRGEKVMGLKEIADQYGSTPSGKLASLLAGESLINLKKATEARVYFEKATDSESEVVKKGGYAGMGVCYENENNLAEAVKQYEKAAELSLEPSSKARFMFYSALCYERMGENSKAEPLLLDLVGNKDYLEFANLANAALVRIGTKIE